MKKHKVLVVEDEKITAAWINKILHAEGYQVIGLVPTGEEALQIIENQPADVVLMDIVLEGELDGIETARIIGEKYNIPVIYLTAYSDEHRIDRAQFTEPFGYILKPIQERELLANIRITLIKADSERRVKENERQLNALLRHSPMAVFTCAADGAFLYGNEIFFSMFDCTAHNSPDTINVFSDILSTFAGADEILQALRENAIVRGLVVRGKNLSGAVMDFRVSASRIDTTDAYAEFFIEDITESVAITEKSKKLEAKFSSVFYASAQPYLLMDNNLNILETNTAYQSLLTMLFGPVNPKIARLEQLLPGVGDLVEKLQVPAQTSSPVMIAGEFKITDIAGNEYWYEAVIAPVLVAGSIDFREMTVTLSDITTRKEMEQNRQQYITRLENQQQQLEEQSRELSMLNSMLKESEQHLQQLNVNKDKFFSIIAHDLRSPFNSLLGFSSYLIEDFNLLDAESVLSIVTEMNKAIKSVYTLLENLLQWSRIQTGRIDFSPEETQFSDLLHGVIKMYAPIAARKVIHLHDEVPQGVTMFVDKNMMTSALQNLISNAIKFTQRGGSVQIGYEQTISYHIIKVTYNGIGMTEASIEKIFRIEENYTMKGTEDESGSGLGLILTKEFIEKHAGSISVSSQPGVGTEFRILIPV